MNQHFHERFGLNVFHFKHRNSCSVLLWDCFTLPLDHILRNNFVIRDGDDSCNKNANEASFTPIAMSGGLWSLESCDRFCVGAVGRNVASVALELFLHLVYVIQTFYKCCIFNSICKCCNKLCYCVDISVMMEVFFLIKLKFRFSKFEMVGWYEELTVINRV
jgi:hypothetical protein